MLKSIAKIIGGSAEKVVKKLQPQVDSINELESSFERLDLLLKHFD